MAQAENQDQGRRADPSSLADRLRKKYGDAINPTVSLAGEAPVPTTGPGSRPSSGILDRLGAHGLKETRYRLQGEIARGGMGAILKVWDEDIRRELAMKVVLGRSTGDAGASATASADEVDPRMLGRFLEEAQINGQLDHPCIVPVHELGLDSSGQVYFTMRLVRGRDLQHIFGLIAEEQEGWNTVRALGAMLKVCEAMAYAHAKGVIHRDLKPANIMVGRFGEVYVMDWGLARVLGRADSHDIRLSEGALPSIVETDRKDEEQGEGAILKTMDGDVIGTPAYMSPEQSRGKIDELGPRTDVYAVGAMIYQLLTGLIPYMVPGGEDSSPVEILQRSWKGPPMPIHELRKDVPVELAAICEKAMARELDDRYPDMQALADDLRAFLEHRVVKAYQTGAVAEFKKWVSRNKGLAAVSSAALFLALAGLGLVGYVEARGRKAANEQRVRAEENEQLAIDSAAEARRQEGIARRERSNVLRLSAFQKLGDLQTQAADLWPAYPEHIDAYDTWLAEAGSLLEGLQPNPADDDIGHYAQLVELRARAMSQEGVELEFATEQDRWWYGQLTTLIAELEAFADEDTGVMKGFSAEWGWGIEKRLEFARNIAERSTTGAEASELWEEAIDSIWDPDRSPEYDGLLIPPQLGLLPIGRDPDSGLWEFAHLQTGEPAQRGTDGKLILTEETGLVFVLLPGGTFTMGAQGTDPGGTNYYAGAGEDEAPVKEVTLDPFFISKYEMTQGQWMRFTAVNPSEYGRQSDVAPEHTLMYPVEEVSWDACEGQLRHMGLVLPTEAQWEYAARGGTTTPWFTGPERDALEGFVNIADQAGKAVGAAWPDIADWPGLNDSHAVQGPIGTYGPNPFGLHEMLGNLWEWCGDLHFSYTLGVEPGTGERLTGTSRGLGRVIRGGGYGNGAAYARSAFRHYASPEFQEDDVGLRPARVLDR